MDGVHSGFDSFDPVAILKRPHVILRIISLVFSIVVAACISNDAWRDPKVCQFNKDSAACNYGTTVAILSCCTIVVFILIDFCFDRLSDSQLKKMIVLADAIFFGLWTFLWFVCFCYLCNAWNNTESSSITPGSSSGMKASIAFSFFSILTCGGITGSAYIRYQQQGTGEDFLTGYDDHSGTPSTHRSSYSSLPSGNTSGGGARMPASEASDTKPLTSDAAYQPQNY